MKEIYQWFAEKGFTCIKQIGQGSFGAVYNIQSSHGENICAKVEILNPLDKSYLIYEAYILKLLRDNVITSQVEIPGILRMFSYDIIQDIRQLSSSYLAYEKQQGYISANIIFMEYGGISLSEFRKTNKIDAYLWFDIFKQLILTLQSVHNIGIIHRDLKPQNILIKPNHQGKQQTYIIDFGLARMLKRSNKQVVIQNRQMGFAGTINYASIRTHKGDIQYFADDLESILYIMLYLAIGTLPWMNIGIKQSVEDMYSVIKMMKIQLTQGQGHQKEDKRFSQYSDKLTIQQIQFLRYFCNMIFKFQVGNTFKSAKYQPLIDKIIELENQ